MRGFSPFVVLVLLLACGLSFGAGWVLGTSQDGPRPEYMAHIQPDTEHKPEVRPAPNTGNENAVPSPITGDTEPVQSDVKSQPAPGVTAELETTESEATDPESRSREELHPVPDPLARRLREAIEAELELDIGGASGDEESIKATISGTVYDAFGRPVAGASVHGRVQQVRSAGSTQIMFMTHSDGPTLARTDNNGQFTIELSRAVQPGSSLRLLMHASAEGHAASERLTVNISDGDNLTGQDLRLKQAATVTGRVINEFGAVMAGVSVRLGGARAPSGVVLGGGNTPRPGQQTAITDEQGNFEFTNVAPGEYSVIAEATGHVMFRQPQQITVMEGVPLRVSDVTLAQSTTIIGRLVNAATDEPLIFRASVSVNRMDGRHLSNVFVAPNREGNFEYTGLEAGSYELVFNVRGYEPHRVTVSLATARTSDLGDIRLTPVESD
jgi:protocatechuate 3,4-dioxygenase beta subunit